MLRVNRTLLRVAIIILLFSNSALAFAEKSPIRAWDEGLSELQLPTVNVNGNDMGDFLIKFMRQHFLRINFFLNRSVKTKGPFAYEAKNVTVGDVLNALCTHYDVQWVRDVTTKVIWVFPNETSVDDLLYPKVVISEPWPGMPMLNDLLMRVGRSYFQHRAEDPDVKPLGLYVKNRGTSYMALFDYPTNISPGTYSASEVLQYCFTLSPSFALMIWDDEDAPIVGYRNYEIAPISLTVADCNEKAAGRDLLYQLLANESDLEPSEVLNTLLRNPDSFPLGSYMVRTICSPPEYTYEQAMLEATTFIEKTTVFNGYFYFGCNYWVCRYPLSLSESGGKLLNEENYANEVPSLVLPLLLNVVRTIESREDQRQLLSRFSKIRIFEANDLKGLEVEVGRAAYFNEQIWQALTDRESDIYIDTGGWAEGFLPSEYTPRVRFDEHF